MTEPRFVYVTEIRTTPERLWRALTTPAFTRQYWWGREIESDFTVGSPVRLRYDNGTKLDIDGEILAADPPKLLSYTFSDPESRERGEPHSRVSFTIEPSENFEAAVRLTVVHDGFAAGSPQFEGISNGWPDILSSLKTLLESGEPLPYR